MESTQEGAPAESYAAEENRIRVTLVTLNAKRDELILAVARGTAKRVELTEITEQLVAAEAQLRDVIDIQEQARKLQIEQDAHHELQEYRDTVAGFRSGIPALGADLAEIAAACERIRGAVTRVRLACETGAVRELIGGEVDRRRHLHVFAAAERLSWPSIQAALIEQVTAAARGGTSTPVAPVVIADAERFAEKAATVVPHRVATILGASHQTAGTGRQE